MRNSVAAFRPLGLPRSGNQDRGGKNQLYLIRGERSSARLHRHASQHPAGTTVPSPTQPHTLVLPIASPDLPAPPPIRGPVSFFREEPAAQYLTQRSAGHAEGPNQWFFRFVNDN